MRRSDSIKVGSCKKRNGRVIAVGTTVTRTLESVFQQKKNRWSQWWGKQIFLYERALNFLLLTDSSPIFIFQKFAFDAGKHMQSLEEREYCKSINKQLRKNIAFSPTGMRCCFCHNYKIDQENRQHRSIFSQNGLHFNVIFGDYEFLSSISMS